MYQTAMVKCAVCGHGWVAVFPIDATTLECPECGYVNSTEVAVEGGGDSTEEEEV